MAIALTRATIDGSSGTLAIALPFAAIDGSTAPGGSTAVAPRLAGRTGGIGALASALVSARTLDVLGAEPSGPPPGIMALPAIASLMLGALLHDPLLNEPPGSLWVASAPAGSALGGAGAEDSGGQPIGRARPFAGLTLASMNIPQVLGYTRIAGTPVVRRGSGGQVADDDHTAPDMIPWPSLWSRALKSETVSDLD